MHFADLAPFAIPLSAACAVPGPTTMLVVARVTAYGTTGTALLCTGLIAGDLIWLAVATGSTAMLVTTAAPIFDAIRWAGAAYLLYVAWQLMHSPADEQDLPQKTYSRASGEILSGLFLALGNAKTALFYLALVPAFVPLAHIGLVEFAMLSATVVVVYGCVLAAYAIAAARARHFLSSPAMRRRMNRVAGGIVAASAIFVIIM
jgi:threonine/homoserine/homoserine lactone efflux protein